MNQRIGYARVSTDDQHIYLQRDALTQAGCSSIYEEAASGKTATRLELEQCRKALRAGDILVVWLLDRLGRSLPYLVQIVADLEGRGIGFESLTEKIETGSGQVCFPCICCPVGVRAEFDPRTHAGRSSRRPRPCSIWWP